MQQQQQQQQGRQRAQTESFLFDSSGNQIYTGIKFDATKLSSVSNKKLKVVAQSMLTIFCLNYICLLTHNVLHYSIYACRFDK